MRRSQRKMFDAAQPVWHAVRAPSHRTPTRRRARASGKSSTCGSGQNPALHMHHATASTEEATHSVASRGTGVASVASGRAPHTFAIARARQVLDELFGPVSGREFAVRFWDGTVDSPRHARTPYTFVITSPGALRRALLPPSELRLAMAYIRGELEIEGDLERASAL